MSKAMVTVYQYVQDGPLASSPSTLYWRWYHMDFLPQPGQRVVLYSYDGESTTDGPMNTVKETYFGTDGNAYIDLLGYVQVTDDQDYQSWHSTAPWFKDADGDINELLLANGWKKYRAFS